MGKITLELEAVPFKPNGEGDAGSPPGGGEGPTPEGGKPFQRMIDERLAGISAWVEDDPAKRFRISHAWLVIAGNKETAPEWARPLMTAAGAGGDHHCFGQVRDKNGNVIASVRFTLGWPGGSDSRLPESDGWANIPIYAGYNPALGPGPYWWEAEGGERFGGLGLPLNRHYSFWAIWQEV